jgi:hypothetical protein
MTHHSTVALPGNPDMSQYYIRLHNRILPWLLDSIKCLPKQWGLHSAESSDPYRTCEVTSAWVLLYAPGTTLYHHSYRASFWYFQVTWSSTDETWIPERLLLLKPPPSIGLLELLAPCCGMPELLAGSLQRFARTASSLWWYARTAGWLPPKVY